MKKKNIITIFIITILLSSVLMHRNAKATEINQVPEANQNAETTNTTASFYSNDITWSWEYFEASGDIMPYGLCTPSTAEDFEALPVIVWLHGSSGANGESGSRNS